VGSRLGKASYDVGIRRAQHVRRRSMLFAGSEIIQLGLDGTVLIYREGRVLSAVYTPELRFHRFC
jgi:hypothetical protein